MVSGVRRLEIHRQLDKKQPKPKSSKGRAGRKAPATKRYGYKSGHR